MHILDAKLVAWRKVYDELKEARARYKQALAMDAPTLSHLKAEVDRLQNACGIALDEMQAELARLKSGGDSTRE